VLRFANDLGLWSRDRNVNEATKLGGSWGEGCICLKLPTPLPQLGQGPCDFKLLNNNFSFLVTVKRYRTQMLFRTRFYCFVILLLTYYASPMVGRHYVMLWFVGSSVCLYVYLAPVAQRRFLFRTIWLL